MMLKGTNLCNRRRQGCDETAYTYHTLDLPLLFCTYSSHWLSRTVSGPQNRLYYNYKLQKRHQEYFGGTKILFSLFVTNEFYRNNNNTVQVFVVVNISNTWKSLFRELVDFTLFHRQGKKHRYIQQNFSFGHQNTTIGHGRFFQEQEKNSRSHILYGNPNMPSGHRSHFIPSTRPWQ